jgi:hypothetical protein
MADKRTYAEKLRDPRWQKRRLEILNRDEFTCRSCGDSESTLHVHHRCYISGKEPWEYEDDYLVTLCEDCHKSEGVQWPELQRLLIDTLKLRIFSSDLITVAEMFHTMPWLFSAEVQTAALSWFLSDEANVKRVMDEYFANRKSLREKREAELAASRAE